MLGESTTVIGAPIDRLAGDRHVICLRRIGNQAPALGELVGRLPGQPDRVHLEEPCPVVAGECRFQVVGDHAEPRRQPSQDVLADGKGVELHAIELTRQHCFERRDLAGGGFG